MIIPVDLSFISPINRISPIQTSLKNTSINTDINTNIFTNPIKETSMYADGFCEMQEIIQDTKNQEIAMTFITIIKKVADFFNRLLNL